MIRDKLWIAENYERMREFYAKRNANMHAWEPRWSLDERFYFQDANGEYIEPADDEERVVPATAFNVIQGMQQLLLTRPPHIHVPRSEFLKQAADQAEDIENMLYAIWHEAHVYPSLINASWFQLCDGWLVLHAYMDDSVEPWESPIRMEYCDPTTVYPCPGRGPYNWKWVIRAYSTTVSEVMDTYFGSKIDRRRNADREFAVFRDYLDVDTVEVVEYWDKEDYAVLIRPKALVEDAPEAMWTGVWAISPQAHNYGFLPWTIRYGLELPLRRRGEQFGVSVLYPLTHLALYWARLLSQNATIIRRYADPLRVSKTLDREGVDWTAGEIALGLEEDIRYMKSPGTSPDVMPQLAEIRGQIEASTLPAVFFGGYAGRMSGIALELLRQPTLMKIAFIQKAIESACEEVNQHFLRLIEQFVPTKRYIRGKLPDGTPIETYLDGSVVNGYYYNQVTLSASIPSEAPSIVTMLLAAEGQKVLSKRTVRQVMQQVLNDITPQNLGDEEEQIIMEFMLTNPEFLTGLAMQVAQRYGIQMPTPPGGAAESEPGLTQPGGAALSGMPAGVVAPQTRKFAPKNTEPSRRQHQQRVMQASGLGQRGGRPVGS